MPSVNLLQRTTILEIFCWQLLFFLGDIPLPLGTFLQCAIFLIKMNVLEALKLFLKIQGLGRREYFVLCSLATKHFLRRINYFIATRPRSRRRWCWAALYVDSLRISKVVADPICYFPAYWKKRQSLSLLDVEDVVQIPTVRRKKQSRVEKSHYWKGNHCFWSWFHH